MGLVLVAGTTGQDKAVVYVRGSSTASLREELCRVVAEQLNVVPAQQFIDALRAESQGTVSDEDAPLRKAVSAVGASVVVIGHVQTLGKRQSLRLNVLDVANDTMLASDTVTIATSKKHGRRLVVKTDLRAAKRLVEQALAKRATNPAAEPRAEPDSTPATQPMLAAALPALDTSAAPARDTGSVFGGVALAGRRFTYRDPLSDNLRPYSVYGVPSFRAQAEAYPLVLLGAPRFLRDVGLTAEYAQTLSFKSNATDLPDMQFSTVWRQWQAGARLRMNLGPLEAGVGGSYGALAFEFHGGSDAARQAQVPAVDYRIIRLSVDGRLAVQDLAWLGGLDYLHLASSGPFGDDYFPHSSEAGVEAHLGAAFAAFERSEVRFMLHYTHIFYALKPEPGELNVAGGALDQYVTLEVGLVREL